MQLFIYYNPSINKEEFAIKRGLQFAMSQKLTTFVENGL